MTKKKEKKEKNQQEKKNTDCKIPAQSNHLLQRPSTETLRNYYVSICLSMSMSMLVRAGPLLMDGSTGPPYLVNFWLFNVGLGASFESTNRLGTYLGS